MIKNKLIIASDLDGTIIDHTKNKIEVASKYGYSLSEQDASSLVMGSIVDRNHYITILSEIYGERSHHASHMLGAPAAIRALTRDFGAIRIISRRSNKEGGRKYAFSWIREHLMPPIQEEDIFFVDTDEEKDVVAKRFGVNVYIDDREDTLDKMPSVKHRFLFFPYDEVEVKSKHIVVRNWEEFKNLCEKL